MYTLKRYESTDSLSAWDPSRSKMTAYALRKIASATTRPELVDRSKHVKSYRRQTDLSRRRRLQPTRILKTANALRAKNTRLIRDKEVMEKELQDWRHEKQRTECEELIDRDYAILNEKTIALKEESVEMLMCNTGGRELADRVQQHLAEVAKFFNDQMSTILSTDSNWSVRHKTLVAEKLRDLFVRNIYKMNEWVNVLVKINELPVLN